MAEQADETLAMIGMAIEALDQVERAEEEFRQAAAARGIPREQADLILQAMRRKSGLDEP